MEKTAPTSTLGSALINASPEEVQKLAKKIHTEGRTQEMIDYILQVKRQLEEIQRQFVSQTK
jgi:inactivated superfamily I helicase